MAKEQPPTRKQILDRLGEYAADGSFATDAKQLLKLHAEEGDRGLVIILSSQLEDALFERICRELKKGEENRRALEKGGPLRAFEQRIVMAQALGILTKREADIFDVFRHMRNACAHSRREISFKTPELLSVLILLSPESEEHLSGAKPAVDPAAALILVAAWMFNFLAGETHQQTGARFKGLMSQYARLRGLDRAPAASPKKRSSKQAPGLRRPASGKGRSRQPPSSPE